MVFCASAYDDDARAAELVQDAGEARREHEIEHVLLAGEEFERPLPRDGDHRLSLLAREAGRAQQRAGDVDAAAQHVGAAGLVCNCRRIN